MDLQKFKNYISTGKEFLGNHTPEILLVGGIATLGGALYFTARAGSRTPDVVADHKERLHDVKIDRATNKEAKKSEVAKVYGQTTINLAKEYAPAAVLTSVSITCFCASYGILKKRYAALGVAYAALQQSFDMYRQRVIEADGREKDIYYMTGEKLKSITTEDEEGNKVKQKALINLPDGSVASPYAFKFGKYKENGDLNKQWENSQSYNLQYVLGQQDYLNDQLYFRCLFDDNHYVVKRGSVMLNEIRDLLGEDPTPTGAIVGNRFSNGEPGCNGFIDFRIINGTEIDPEDGREIPCIWIDPNVDGIIYDLLGQFEEEPFYPNYYDTIQGIIDEDNAYEEAMSND